MGLKPLALDLERALGKSMIPNISVESFFDQIVTNQVHMVSARKVRNHDCVTTADRASRFSDDNVS